MKVLPVRRFFSLSRILPAFQQLELLHELEMHTSIAHAVHAKNGGKVLDSFKNNLRQSINKALYDRKGWGRHTEDDDTVIVKDKEGNEKRVFKKAMKDDEMTPKDFLARVGYTGDRFTYGGAGSKRS